MPVIGRIGETWRSLPCSCQRFVARALIFSLVVAADLAIFPDLYSLQVVLSSAVFVTLALRRNEAFRQIAFRDERLSLSRGISFGLANAAVLLVAWYYMPASGVDGSARGFVAPLLRLLVPLSGLILMTRNRN